MEESFEREPSTNTTISMLGNRPRTAASGAISIHSADATEDLLRDSERHGFAVIESSYRRPARSRSAGSISSVGSCYQKRKESRAIDLSFNIRSWLSEKSIRSVQEKTDYESTSIRTLYNSLLENEEDLNQQLLEYLTENEALDRRKKSLLFKKWSGKVYAPLKEEIEKEMNGKDYAQFDRKKRSLYKDYLNYKNRKGDVFLDTMSQEEYNPLTLNEKRPGPLKVVMTKPDDPLLFQQSKRNEEDRITVACETGEQLTDEEIEKGRLPPLPLVPLGRHGTECSTWLAMKLHDIQSDLRHRSQKRMTGIRNYTKRDFQAWRITPANATVVDKELKFQKKRQFYEKHKTTLLLV